MAGGLFLTQGSYSDTKLALKVANTNVTGKKPIHGAKLIPKVPGADD